MMAKTVHAQGLIWVLNDTFLKLRSLHLSPPELGTLLAGVSDLGGQASCLLIFQLRQPGLREGCAQCTAVSGPQLGAQASGPLGWTSGNLPGLGETVSTVKNYTACHRTAVWLFLTRLWFPHGQIIEMNLGLRI